MLEFEPRGIDVDTPAQDTEHFGRPQIDIKLGEVAARFTARLDSAMFDGITYGDDELDAAA